MKIVFPAVLSGLFAFLFPRPVAAQVSRAPSESRLRSSAEVRFVTPTPPYPFLVTGDISQVAVQVTFDTQGQARKVAIIRSTGSLKLDNTITAWIKVRWKCSGGRPTMITGYPQGSRLTTTLL